MNRSQIVKIRLDEIRRRLRKKYPGTASSLCALKYENPFQLLVATILSAQCTDERVNIVTPKLFKEYPDPKSMANSDLESLQNLIRSTGFFNSKAKNIKAMACVLEEQFGGMVPRRIEDLVTLPGVGRKTANVVRSVAFDLPGLPVDTHVTRLSKRLGLAEEDDPVKIEHVLNEIVPKNSRGVLSIQLILHGRDTCNARKPLCGDCFLNDLCPRIGVNEFKK